MANVTYNSYKANELDGTINLATHDIKVVLVNGYAPDIDAHSQYSDITDEVPNGNGYTQGGKTLQNASVTQDNANDRAIFDADDVTWASSTITADGAVIYDDTTTGKELVGYIDFGGAKSSNSGDFRIQWNSAGILTLS